MAPERYDVLAMPNASAVSPPPFLPPPFLAVAGGLRVRVRLSTRARDDRVDGVVATAEGSALGVHVRAVPEQGKANRALLATLASWLGVPRASVTLVAGGRSRNKTLAIAGEQGRLCALVAARLAHSGVRRGSAADSS
jgi:uncharacterized protein